MPVVVAYIYLVFAYYIYIYILHIFSYKCDALGLLLPAPPVAPGFKPIIRLKLGQQFGIEFGA